MCLVHLQDPRSAKSALEKAANMDDAEKYPLAILNCAIFCYQYQEYEASWRHLRRYLEVVESKKRGNESQIGNMRTVRGFQVQGGS